MTAPDKLGERIEQIKRILKFHLPVMVPGWQIENAAREIAALPPLAPAEDAADLHAAIQAFAEYYRAGGCTLEQIEADLGLAPAEDAVEAAAERIREAWHRYEVEGTSGNEKGYGPPYYPPWFLIDKSTAEPDVNWPGELLGEYRDFKEAHKERLRIVARAALASVLAHHQTDDVESAAERARIAFFDPPGVPWNEVIKDYPAEADTWRSVARAALSTPAHNAIALWMIEHSYATGHGDTTEDMLNELEAQVRERCAKHARQPSVADREAAAKAVHEAFYKHTKDLMWKPYAAEAELWRAVAKAALLPSANSGEGA